MFGRLLTMSTIVVCALAVAACGSSDGGGDGGGDDGAATTTTSQAEADETTTTDADADEPTTTTGTAPETTAESSGGGGLIQDVSDVDWATVDLTTIDWANIEMRQIDFEAIRDNPTAASLTEETTALIQSRIDPGHATLTVGDLTWEFDTFDCAFGHDATESSVYSFSSNSFGQHETSRVQMQANIRDESGNGRYTGDGLTHEVFINDITDFDNPIVGWEMNAPDGIVIDGYDVTAEGSFDNLLTGEREEVVGTLDATCSDTSRR